MQIENSYCSTRSCPAEGVGLCSPFPDPQAVVDHLLADHDPRLIATLLVRETYISGRMTEVLEGLSIAVEREINALIPDPLSDDTPMEIVIGNQFGDQR
jgi:hypothetical protein